MLLKAVVSLSLTFSAMASFADWQFDLKVTRIVVVETGGINYRFEPPLSGCTSQSNYGTNYASLYPDHKGFNSIHANLLAAYMSDKIVSIYLTDATCKIGETVLGGRHYD